jgi:hypothetical protein
LEITEMPTGNSSEAPSPWRSRKEDQHLGRLSGSAQQRREPEDPDPRQQDALAAEQVPEPPAGDQQGAERELVDSDRPLEVGGGDVQLARDGGQREVEGEEVDVDAEDRERDGGNDAAARRHPCRLGFGRGRHRAGPTVQAPGGDNRGMPRSGRVLAPGVLLIAGAFLALELAVSSRYGYSRDELYFLACARHMSLGFVDQGPLTPAVAWLAERLDVATPTGLRVLPALAGAATVVVAALTARALGGGRNAQALAALATACSGVSLAAFHLLNTSAFDLLAWAVVVLLVVRIARGADPRWWLVVGAVLGIGLLNKLNPLFLGFGLAVGLLATRERRLLRSPWPWAAAGIALVLWAPSLVWQADHGWPTWDMLQALRRENAGRGAGLAFVPLQFLQLGILLAPLWIAGLWWLVRRPQGAPFRWIAVAYVVLLVTYTLSGGKPYYIAGLYPALFAAGGVAVEQAAGRLVPPTRLVAVLAVLSAVLAAPFALPLLPPSALADVPLQKLNYDLAESIGWPELTAQVSAAARSLPPVERRDAVTITANYGEAGALQQLGAGRVPPVISGHNTYALWPAPARLGGTAIVVGYDAAYLRSLFTSCRTVARVANGLGVDNDEEGEPIAVCTDPRLEWPALRRRIRHFG